MVMVWAGQQRLYRGLNVSVKLKKCCGAANSQSMSMKKVSLATDGSCLGNPGRGGWACLLRFGGAKREIFGFDPDTTNQRMELMAPIQGLLALNGPVPNAYLWLELDEDASLHKPTWRWIRSHADHEDNLRCDWLARNAAATQKSSWPDGRPHAPLRLGLGPDYVPPKPQAGLFGDAEPDAEDDEDDGEQETDR